MFYPKEKRKAVFNRVVVALFMIFLLLTVIGAFILQDLK
jgi:hypothetical protein